MKTGATFRRALRDMGTTGWLVVLIGGFALMGIRDVLFAVATGGILESALEGSAEAVALYLGKLMQAAFLSVPLQLLVAYADGRFNTFGIRNLLRKNIPRIARLSAQEYEKEGSAEALNKVTEDLSQVREYFSSTVPYHICLIVYAVVPLFYLLYQNLLLAAICYTVIPLVIVGMNGLLQPIKKLIGEYARNRASAMQDAQEAIAQIMTVKAMGLEEEMVARLERSQRPILNAYKRQKRYESLAAGLDTFTGKLPTLLIITIGAILVLNGQITVAALIVFNNLGRQGQWLTGVMGEAISAFKGSETRLDRIYELADRTKESDEGMEWHAKHAGSIDVVDLNFGYTQQKPVLRELSLSLNKGEFVVLMGESGCGKSTLANLIAGFYEPDRGSIRIGGVDVRQLPVRALRRLIVYMPQNAGLFSGSIRENLTLGHAGATDEQLWAAVEQAQLGETLRMLAYGMDTQVGEEGSQLSGGQKQRVALARAFLAEAPILILDEPTSNLDEQSAQRIIEAIANMRDKTRIVITHDEVLARAADRVIAMKSGKIA